MRISALVLGLAAVAACATEPSEPTAVSFTGTITDRDHVWGMLVEAEPGAGPNNLCTNGAYYRFLSTMAVRSKGGLASVEDLRNGLRVTVWSSQVQLDSCYPQRGADSIQILP